jgi:multidrug transporter EmrE-like cation transporter
MKPGIYWVVIAILCNVSAQVALKMGANTELGRWQTWLSPAIIIGLGLYGLSFILTIRIYANYPLSVISPIMAGAIFILISLASAVLFAEPLSFQKIGGFALIVAGIAILSRTA